MSNKKGEHRILRAAIASWLWPKWNDGDESLDIVGYGAPSVRTELSTTVFNGEATDWVHYLKLPKEQRYEPGLGVFVYLHPEAFSIAFDPENEDSSWLAEILETGFRTLRRVLERKPNVLKVLHHLIFDNADNLRVSPRIRLSSRVPSDGTRETARAGKQLTDTVELVFKTSMVHEVREALAGADIAASPEQRLGSAWPLLVRLIASLAYPAAPHDLFVTKINVHAKVMYIAVNVLYAAGKGGALEPTATGKVYEDRFLRATGLSRSEFLSRDPYFRALHGLGFTLRAAPYSAYQTEARIVTREFLDPSYLRLSLAGVMPSIPPGMLPMQFRRGRKKLRTPIPAVGSYGVLDEEDLHAWKVVDGPFRDIGFTLLRQLGMGEFGRVYEALNDNNPRIPERVAIKVDRIVGKKKNAILEAEEAMQVGCVLAELPHVMRLYDTGKLAGKRYTYHVLQLINGDTLDDLLGVTGREHASVTRPPTSRSTELEARAEYERAVSSRDSELWRRHRRSASPFTQALSPAMVLDLLTSVLLWLEEVHKIGYASNDLKNGNLMLSRRGQLKGIDLDSYSVAHSPKDKMTDFMFLAVSLILLLFTAPVTDRGRVVPWQELIESEQRLRSGLIEAWPLGDVQLMSDGRVCQAELVDLFVDLVQRSRRLVYSKEPELFTQDIVRLMDLKRRLLNEEFVID